MFSRMSHTDRPGPAIQILDTPLGCPAGSPKTAPHLQFSSTDSVCQSRSVRSYLVLLLVSGLVGMAGLPATAVDPTSSTGQEQTHDRTLTIWAKDSTTVSLADSDPQNTFAEDPKGSSLQDSSLAHKFKITKISLTGSQTLAGVKPDQPATFTAGQVAYVSTDLSQPDNKAVINFSNPVDLSAGTGHVKVTTGEASADGTAFATDTTNPLDVFIDPVDQSDKTADGIYIVQEYQGVNLKPWAAVVEIPTYTSSQIDSLATPAPSSINYDVVVYAKVKTAITPAFSSYVDVLNLPASSSGGNATLVPGRGTGPGANPDDWEKTGITKGTWHTFSASFILNGYSYSGSTSRAVVLGYGYGEMDPAATLTLIREGNGRGTYINAPTTAVANKTMTVSDFLELGVLVRNLDDPTLTKYCPIYNQSYDSINHSSQAGYGSFNSGNLAAPAGWTLGRVRQSGGNMLSNSFGTGQMQWIIPSTGIGPTNTSTTQSNIYESVALSLGAQYMTPVHAVPILDKSRGCFAQDFSDINTQQYNSAEEIFGLTSNIQVEVLASYRAQVNGSAFKAGNTDLVNFKPFLYGATNGYDTSATVDEVNDIFSFEPTVNPPTTGNGTSPTYDYRNKHFNKRVETNAFVYTGAVNAIKVDQDGKPVPDAKFALIQRAEYNPGVETNQYANKVGITGGTSDPEAVGPNFNIASPTASTFANVWVQTTDATGKVSFDGVNPDTNSLSGGKYWIVELASPRGYKDLAHDTVPDLTDYGGTLVKAISLNWADHKVANDKPPADPDYKAMTKVINVPTLSLPNTGGNGLAWLIALGLGLLAGSLLIRRQTMMSRT